MNEWLMNVKIPCAIGSVCLALALGLVATGCTPATRDVYELYTVDLGEIQPGHEGPEGNERLGAEAVYTDSNSSCSLDVKVYVTGPEWASRIVIVGVENDTGRRHPVSFRCQDNLGVVRGIYVGRARRGRCVVNLVTAFTGTGREDCLLSRFVIEYEEWDAKVVQKPTLVYGWSTWNSPGNNPAEILFQGKNIFDDDEGFVPVE